MENMENNPKNWFVRILIILFCLGIASMIFFNFFCVEPYGEFKNGIFFLLSTSNPQLSSSASFLRLNVLSSLN